MEKYLSCQISQNGDRYGTGVNGSWIGNQPWTFNWRHDLWPWMSLNLPSSRSLQLQSNILITMYWMQQHWADTRSTECTSCWHYNRGRKNMFTPCKIYERVCEMSELICQVELSIQHVIYFCEPFSKFRHESSSSKLNAIWPVWLCWKKALLEKLSVTLNFEPMTLKMSSMSCGPGAV